MVDKETNKITKLRTQSKFITINKASYKALKPRNKEYFVRDKKLRGFFIKVYPSGRCSYGAESRLAGVGRPKRKIIGACSLYTAQEAREIARGYIQQIKDGIVPKEQQRIEAEKSRTILDYLEIYINRKGLNLADSTISSYRKQIHRDFASLNNVPITQITKDDIADWYGASVRKKGRSTDHTFTIVKTLLQYAVNDDYISENVAQKSLNTIARYSKPEGVKKHIPLTHLTDFLRGFTNASPYHENAVIRFDDDEVRKISETQRDYILFLLLTGLRKEEASRLKWSDVEMDEEKQIFAVTIQDTKAKRPFRFPMTMTLRAMFEYRMSLPNRNPIYVFPAKSSPRGSERGYINDTRKAFLKIQKLAEFDQTITPHDLRRTFSTICDEMGLATVEVGKLLNHAQREVTEGYIQRSLDNQRRLYDEYTYFIESYIQPIFENTYKNNELENKDEVPPYIMGVKNYFRNVFYGHSGDIVEIMSEPPKPTYWDSYITTSEKLVEKHSQGN